MYNYVLQKINLMNCNSNVLRSSLKQRTLYSHRMLLTFSVRHVFYALAYRLHCLCILHTYLLLNLGSPRDYVGSSVPPFVRSYAPVVLP